MVVTIVITGISQCCISGISCDNHPPSHGNNSCHCMLTNVSIGVSRPWYGESCLLNCVNFLTYTQLSINVDQKLELAFCLVIHIL
jgi:hypothetical protein